MVNMKSKEAFSYLESERIDKYTHDDNERALLSHWLHLRLSRYGGVYEPSQGKCFRIAGFLTT